MVAEFVYEWLLPEFNTEIVDEWFAPEMCYHNRVSTTRCRFIDITYPTQPAPTALTVWG